MKCGHCGEPFDREHSRQKYCDKKCARIARLELHRDREETDEDRIRKAETTRRGEILRRYRLQETKVEEAQLRLQQLRDEARREGILEETLDEARERVARFESEALANASNVTANRSKAFLETQKEQLTDALLRWAFERGLTPFDVEAIWAHMLGNPRPIVVEPEEESLSVLDFLDDEELDEAA